MAINAYGEYVPDENPIQDVGLGKQLQDVNLNPIMNPSQAGNVDPSRFYNTQYGNTIRNIQQKYTQARDDAMRNPQATGLGGIQQQRTLSDLDANKSFADVQAQGEAQKSAVALNEAKQREALAPLQLGSQIAQNQATNRLEAAKIKTAANEGVLNRGAESYENAQDRDLREKMALSQQRHQSAENLLDRESKERTQASEMGLRMYEGSEQRAHASKESLLGRRHTELESALEREENERARKFTAIEERKKRKFQRQENIADRGIRQQELKINEKNNLMNYILASNTQRERYDLARSRLQLDHKIAQYQMDFNAQTIANNAQQIKNAFAAVLMKDARTEQAQEWAIEQANRQYVMLAQQAHFNQMLKSREIDLKSWAQKSDLYLKQLGIQLDAAKIEQLQMAYDRNDMTNQMKILASLISNLEGQERAEETIRMLQRTAHYTQSNTAAALAAEKSGAKNAVISALIVGASGMVGNLSPLLVELLKK